MSKKFRKITSIIISLLILFGTLTVTPTSYAVEDPESVFEYDIWYVDDGLELIHYAVILGYNGNASDVVIPSTLGGYDVTLIETYSFSMKYEIESITIPDTVTGIAPNAFENCKNLKSIDIPDSVTDMEGNAFSGCTSLTAINVGESNKKYCSVDGVLFNKNKTQLIKYPEGKASTEYAIPGTVETVYENAFSNLDKLTKAYIPDSVTYLGEGAFSGCTNLESVVLSNNITILKKNTFSNCKNLKDITIPESVEIIENSVFGFCTSLESVVIPAKVTTISNLLFAYCSNLKDVTLQNNITTINSGAFLGCTSLNSVIIPKSVTTISARAFGYYYDENRKLVSNENFIVYGYNDTVAETYAYENGFIFNEINFSLGDINGDGKINVIDATEIQKYSVGLNAFNSEQNYYADVTKDNRVNVIDATEIQKYSVGSPSALD